jgi:membrane protein DedA with SNARE-associated domain
MSLAILISRFGYPALILGLLLEGETVLVLAAFMAHRGYMSLPLVIVIGCLVSFASDQFFFWMGRTRGSRFLEKRPAWKQHIEKATSLLGRNPNLLFLGVRFMYGLRTAMPFVMGMARFDPKEFALLDFVGALLWALIFGLAGKLIGNVMGGIFEDVKEHELAIALGIVLVGICFWLYQRYRDRIQADIDHA